MESALAEFGTTIVLGGFFILSLAVIFAILYLSNLLPNFFYTSRFNAKNYITFGTIPILILCYVFGMLLEDWSNPVLTSDRLKWTTFPDENDIRANAFYGRYANEYAEKGLITKLLDKTSKPKSVENWIVANRGVNPVDSNFYLSDSPDFTENEFIHPHLIEMFCKDIGILCDEIVNDSDVVTIENTEFKIDRVSIQNRVNHIGLSEFNKDEFKSPYTEDTLYEAITTNKNFKHIPIISTNNNNQNNPEQKKDTFKFLNKLLKTIDIYDKTINMENLVNVNSSYRVLAATFWWPIYVYSDNLTKEIKYLAQKTKVCRDSYCKSIKLNSNNCSDYFDELSQVDKINIKRLNRLILENVFPKETPKIQSTSKLNSFLTIPYLYDIFISISKKKDLSSSRDIKYLADITKDYRNKEYKNLKDEQKTTIKRLNRLIVEAYYPYLAPKNNPPNKEDFIDVAWRILYMSKNPVYRDNNYFIELSKIEERIFFARSFCLSILIILIIFFPLSVTIIFLPGLITQTRLAPLTRRLDKYYIYNGIFIIFFIGLFYVGREAFKAEEKAFDLRVFGYYLSLPVEKPKQTKYCSVSKFEDQTQDKQVTLNANSTDTACLPTDNFLNKYFIQQQYIDAIQDAKVAEPGEIYRYLVAIKSKGKDGLIWDEKGEYVLVVTWTDWDRYREYIGKSMVALKEIWVTTYPEIKKEYCGFINKDKDDITLRLEQLLGLPPNSGKFLIVEIWVKPDDLFRPCPDPEINDTVSKCRFPSLEESASIDDEYKKWISAYKYWYDNKLNTSYTYDGYPWTRLGYTFDWGGDPNSDVGLSEFVIKKGATIKVESVTNTSIYCTQITTKKTICPACSGANTELMCNGCAALDKTNKELEQTTPQCRSSTQHK